jgi:hypothetical protein
VSIDAIENGWIPMDHNQWPPWKTVNEILGSTRATWDGIQADAIAAAAAGTRKCWP